MSLDCPRCHEVKLEEIEVGDVLVDRCPRCAGIWFDHDEVGGIIGKRGMLKTLESIVPPSQYAVDTMYCPRCPDVSLRKLELSGSAGRTATAYRCVSCAGTWFDRGELREVEDPQLLDALTRYLNLVFPE
jgi:Zn-finger nucleic acid-binding protein